MQIVCSWCGKSIKEREPLGDKSISHSICEECYKKVGYEVKKFKERLGRALQIAKREWENIRVSLQGCGDIGEFNSKDYVNGMPALVSEGSLLVRNLIEMDNKLSTYGYFTPEASYVFTTLASSAGERLGLTDKLAQAFGSGYSWIRTGCLNSNGTEGKELLKRMVFFKLFFPLGVYLIWDFNSPLVKIKLKTVFNKFVLWQDAPRSYIQDIEDYKTQLEPLLFGLSLALDLPLAGMGKEYI